MSCPPPQPRRTHYTTAILMLNLGGPSNQSEVEPFLTRLLSDREIIKIPFQKYSGPLLAKRRSKKVKKQYEMIGGGSPIKSWTERQGHLLCQKLDRLHPSTAPHKPFIAFRYAEPLTETAIREISDQKIGHIVVFSQYPQYSCSTTGSSLNELYRKLEEYQKINDFRFTVIDRWGTHRGLIQSFAELIRRSLLDYFKEEERDSVILLFSAHSLPLSVVDRGDPYPHEVAATVKEVMKELGDSHPHKIVWQSKVGPTKWLQPTTGDALVGLASKGHRNFLLVPIAFTSDHIETLYEYDIMYKKLAEEKNINLKRVPALNDHPTFINAMADIVIEHIDKNHSVQLKLRCPQCVNDDCGHMKNFFTNKNHHHKLPNK